MDDPIPYLVEGVLEDCEALLIKFEKQKSLRFSVFTEIWKEMKFSNIYAEKKLTEIDLFVPEILLMVKQYFIKAGTLNLKVGALYLLYGLYYKQPLKNYKKINITLSDWEVIKEFINELRDSTHFDTLLILCKLITDNAFLYSYLPRIRKNVIPEKFYRHGLFDTNTLVEDMDMENDFKELSELEKQYSEVKKSVAESMSSKNINSSDLYYSSENFSKELLEILNTPKESKTEEETIDPGEGCSKFGSLEDIGDRRRALKHRSIEDKIKKPRNR